MSVFRRLGVFAGGFTMEMAQAVASDAELDEWAVLDHLSALVDKSLVVADAGDAPRYRLLESARAFALEQLATGETAETLKRHALAMWSFLERVDNANLDGELRTDRYAALVLPELDNLRAAHTWATSEIGDVGVAIALAAHAVRSSTTLSSAPTGCCRCERTSKTAPRARPHCALLASHRRRQHVRARASCAASRSGIPRPIVVRGARPAAPGFFQSDPARAAPQRAARRRPHQAALDEARALLRPDWPLEFRIYLLRISGHIARRPDARRGAHVRPRWRPRQCGHGGLAPRGDGRHNLGNVLWTADRSKKLRARRANSPRTCVRPAANSDMAVLYANLVGILSEAGRIDDASAAASEALPIMHRAHALYLEEWVYLFWRRGQIDTAALLLGALDAVQLRTAVPLQVNEVRLMAEARLALEALLRPEALSGSLAAGAALGEAELFALISEALAQPSGIQLKSLASQARRKTGSSGAATRG
jgi:hypothetical protein